MQASSGVNALMSLGAAPVGSAAANGAPLTGGDDKAAGGQSFAQLLGDLGAQADGKNSQGMLRGSPAMATGGNLLQAQASPASVALMEMLGGTSIVTPAQAQEMIATIDAWLPQLAALPSLDAESAHALINKMLAGMRQSGGASAEGLGDAAQGQSLSLPLPATVSQSDVDGLVQLKAQLQQVVDGNRPRPASEILASFPAGSGQKLSALLLVGFAREEKKVAKDSVEEVPDNTHVAMQMIPSFRFRPAARETEETSRAAQPEEEKIPESVEMVTVLTPVAFEATAVMPVAPAQGQAAFFMAAPTLPIAANDAPFSSDVAPDSAMTIDQLVPPLAVKDAAPKALPEVVLPKLGAVESAPASSLIDVSGAPQGGAEIPALMGVSSVENTVKPEGVFIPQSVGPSPLSAPTFARLPERVLPQGMLNQAPVSEQVQVAIQQAGREGVERLTIQLDPIDLGRVEVQMHTNKDGQTQIHFTIDKPETFDHLSRDARMLERSLQEAGIKADTGSMQFNLRQQPQPHMQSGLGGGQQQAPQQQAEQDEANHGPVMRVQALDARTRHYTINLHDGVDISA